MMGEVVFFTRFETESGIPWIARFDGCVEIYRCDFCRNIQSTYLKLVSFLKYSGRFDPGVLPPVPKQKNRSGIREDRYLVFGEGKMVGDVIVAFGIVGARIA
jgi:hypothetical protein